MIEDKNNIYKELKQMALEYKIEQNRERKKILEKLKKSAIILKKIPKHLNKKDQPKFSQSTFRKIGRYVRLNQYEIHSKFESFLYKNSNIRFIDLIMYENKTYEILIKGIEGIKEDESVIDEEKGITYSLGEPSENYVAKLLLNLLEELKSKGNKREISRIFDDYVEELSGKSVRKEDIDKYFYEKSLVKLSTLSLKIEIDEKEEIQEFDEKKVLQKLFDAFSFEYMYSKNEPIIISENIYEAFGIKNETISNKIVSFHKKDVDIPLEYNSKLINFYRNGIKAEDPYIQYLSYYHILEYHYYRNLKNKVANKLREGLEDIQNNKAEDVASNIIKTVNKGTQERTVLKSILEENIADNIQNLRKRIIEINDNVPYIISINFSNASSINWDESVSNIIDQITNRIYDTRNSLVHSKEDEIEKIYEPWNDKHVKELKKEIPLIRALAELIMKNTGENINLD